MNAPLPVLKPAEERSGKINLDPRAYARGLSCVHCGLCLPACPTYTQTGNEADSPRGRIQLMLGLADGRIELTNAVKHHLDLCLDCRGCETACPSGVVYHELIEETRSQFAKLSPPTRQDRFMRWIFFNIFTHPRRLKMALLPARLMQKIGLYPLLRRSGLFRLLPPQLRKMEQMLPAEGSLWPRPLPEQTRGRAVVQTPEMLPPFSAKNTEPLRTREGVVSFFPGCIGSVMFEKVNQQSIELLAATGTDVIVPRTQACCGAMHHHNGEHHAAAGLARRNIDAFERVAGAVVTNIAGCGAMLREYDLLLRDDPVYAERAKAFVARVRDVSEALLELGPPPMRHAVAETVTYHDACHLAHAQKVTAPPRTLLGMIPGLQLLPLPESDMCCGAAGTYNLQHPEMASQLAERKLENIAGTRAMTCVTGNAGCAMHIQSQADARHQPLRVVHPVTLLHRAVFGERG
jgi:glycolate oxidase iron-sulfur subunit